MYWDIDTVNDRIVVTWDDVGYYNSRTDKLNAFQLILDDCGNGNFDITFRYEDIDWTTGGASGGTGCLGGTPAHAGFTAVSGDPAAYFELPASGIQADILALNEVAGNTGLVGLWEFNVRGGDITITDISDLPGFGTGGWIAGDPHLMTLDGVGYSFQAVGEYVLLREAGVANGFEIQARFEALGAAVSVTTAVSTRVGSDTVMIDASDGNLNKDVALANGTPLAHPFVAAELYGIYRDDWRVDIVAEMLFNYNSDETLAGFYDADFPGAAIMLDMFAPAEVTTAELLASQAGLTVGTANFKNAVLDYLLTSDTGFITSCGRDTLFGGAGDDTLRGGASVDVFVFESGRDIVEDWFVDILRIQTTMGSVAGLTGDQVLNRFGSTVGADYVLDFGNGNSITLLGQGAIFEPTLAGHIEIA